MASRICRGFWFNEEGTCCYEEGIWDEEAAAKKHSKKSDVS
jgi:hypothetical protein